MGSPPRGPAAKGAPPTDRQTGLYRGRAVARHFLSSDGWTILVGRSAADNDVLTFKLGRPGDFWLHVAGSSGSHVVVLNDEGAKRMPRDTQRLAAAFAAGYSKARAGGQVAVHLATVADVTKPRGMKPGKVNLRRHSTVHAHPERGEEE